MSNKGAIKKTVTTKDAIKSQSKTKSKTTGETTTDGNEKVDSSHLKKQISDHRGDGDRRAKVSQSSLTNKTQSTRSSSKQSHTSSQAKLLKQTSSSSTSKSSVSKSPSSRSGNTTVGSRTKPDNARKSDKTTERSKPKERSQAGYSEKRGTSTIYMPKSTASRVGTKSTEKIVQSTRDKEKLRNAQKSNMEKHRGGSRERRRSRTLSPSEVKMLHSAVNRPKHALQKESEGSKVSNKEVDDDDYEDDFEDYESDFQECTDSDESSVSEKSNESNASISLDPIELQTQQRRTVVRSAEHQKVEEEHMYDSGHYGLAEARKRAARVESITPNLLKSPPPLPELRQPVNKAYSEEVQSENKSLPSSTDEGFEDSRSGDFAKSPPLSQISFIDFRKPKKDQTVKKPPKILTRGEELLEMIKLDTMEWSLLECTPIPYDEFIRNYGRLNTQQMSTQTGEDDMDVEVQTDEILHRTMWTQFPITCRKELRNKRDIDLFRMEQIGVGSDKDLEDPNISMLPSYDVLQLNEFLNRAGTVMLSLLEERRFGGNVFQNDTRKMPFSDEYVKLSVDTVTFLAGRAVTIIHYSEVLNKVLLTIHAPAEEEIETSSKQDYITDCCIGCVWNISQPSMPKKLFYSPCAITACSFHVTNYNIVFAGLEDGSVSLWDLKEDEMWHQKITDKANEVDWTIRTPTYTTTGNEEIDGHQSQIMTIQILSKIETKSLEKRNNKFVPIQICTLDEEGRLIIWSVLHNMGVSIDDLGLSQWGNIRLVKSQEISLKTGKGQKKNNVGSFVDMSVDCVDANNLYVITNTTNVLHATCLGNKTNPLIYKNYEIYPCGSTTCIERCPFEKSYFLVGCNDGTIRLHSLSIERPILQIKDERYRSGVRMLQWSKSKPLMIYVLDKDSRIHVWDLINSDTHSSYTTTMQEYISSMQLSPCKTEQDMINQYLAIGTESGTVEIHKLKKEFYHSKKQDVVAEMNTFLRYTAIL